MGSSGYFWVYFVGRFIGFFDRLDMGCERREKLSANGFLLFVVERVEF